MALRRFEVLGMRLEDVLWSALKMDAPSASRSDGSRGASTAGIGKGGGGCVMDCH
jgi:hypothetical protein